MSWEWLVLPMSHLSTSLGWRSCSAWSPWANTFKIYFKDKRKYTPWWHDKCSKPGEQNHTQHPPPLNCPLWQRYHAQSTSWAYLGAWILDPLALHMKQKPVETQLPPSAVPSKPSFDCDSGHPCQKGWGHSCSGEDGGHSLYRWQHGDDLEEEPHCKHFSMFHDKTL